MTLTVPDVLGVLGLAFTVVSFIWCCLDTVSEAIRKENREAHDGITTRIDGLREHMDAKFEGGDRFAASAPNPPAKGTD